MIGGLTRSGMPRRTPEELIRAITVRLIFEAHNASDPTLMGVAAELTGVEDNTVEDLVLDGITLRYNAGYVLREGNHYMNGVENMAKKVRAQIG